MKSQDFIECQKCKGYIHIEATSCKHCGAYTNNKNPNITLKESEKIAGYPASEWKAAFTIFAICIAGFIWYNSSNKIESAESKTESNSNGALVEAFSNCQYALEKTANADFPFIEGYKDAGGYNFGWGASTKFGVSKNGTGALISASCNTNNEGQIQHATINGKTVFERQ